MLKREEGLVIFGFWLGELGILRQALVNLARPKAGFSWILLGFTRGRAMIFPRRGNLDPLGLCNNARIRSSGVFIAPACALLLGPLARQFITRCLGFVS